MIKREMGVSCKQRLMVHIVMMQKGFQRFLFLLLLIPGICPARGGVIQSKSQATATPDELLPYLHARSIIDFSQRGLIEWFPELKNLEFAQTQEELPLLLDRVGENVEIFFRDFPNTSALENVYQERWEPGGARDDYLKPKYHYIISASSDPDELGLEEYRTNLKDEKLTFKDLKGSYLLTSGYASHPLYFHPRNRSASNFRCIGRERSGQKAIVIAFAQIPEKTKTLGSITLMGQHAVILVQGAIWVAPDSFQILRMQTDLLVSRSDIGLNQHATRIEFEEIAFPGISRKLWLPREVLITIQFQGYKFRNLHRYTQYKLFSVESKDGPKKLARP